nr:hypothetical protein [Bowdeniella nasicola]
MILADARMLLRLLRTPKLRGELARILANPSPPAPPLDRLSFVAADGSIDTAALAASLGEIEELRGPIAFCPSSPISRPRWLRRSSPTSPEFGAARSILASCYARAMARATDCGRLANERAGGVLQQGRHLGKDARAKLAVDEPVIEAQR